MQSTTAVRASARARSHLNFSPLLSTAYGRNHAGGELKPTHDNTCVISLTDCSPNPSITARSGGQSAVCCRASPKCGAGDCAFSAPAGADDQADLPIVFGCRKLDIEALRGFAGKWKIEHAGQLPDAEAVMDF